MLNFRNWTDDKAEVRGTGGETVKERSEARRCRCAKQSDSREILCCMVRRVVAPEGPKVDLLKRLVRRHPGRGERKSYTMCCREAGFQVKMCEEQHSRTVLRR